MTDRLIRRIPNPLALTQWASLFSACALLRLIGVGISVIQLFTLWHRIGNLPVAGVMTSFLRGIVEALILLGSAGLLRWMAGRREELRLGRHVGTMLWFLASLELALLGGAWLNNTGQLHGVPRLLASSAGLSSSLGWIAFHGLAGWFVFRYTRLLHEARQQALPAGGELLFAARRLGAGAGAVRPVVWATLIGLGLVDLTIGSVGGLLEVSGQPKFGPIVLQSPAVLLAWLGRTAYEALYPGALLLAIVGWGAMLGNKPRWQRLGHLFPLALWLAGVLRLAPSLNYLIILSTGAGGRGGWGVFLILLPVLMTISWAAALVGAGFAVRAISRLLEETRQEVFAEHGSLREDTPERPEVRASSV